MLSAARPDGPAEGSTGRSMDPDDILPKKPKGVILGESLAALSSEELEARLALIEEERRRIEAEIAAKRASRQAAEAFFKS